MSGSASDRRSSSRKTRSASGGPAARAGGEPVNANPDPAIIERDAGSEIDDASVDGAALEADAHPELERVEAKPRARTRAPKSSAGELKFETMAEAMEFLTDRVDLERSRSRAAIEHAYTLDRMRALALRLGNPQDAVRTIHVAGTKGKGSTCEMAATALEACGYTVGAYTSPHLVDIRERIRINRLLISEPDFVRLAMAVGGAAQAIEAEFGEATFFELMTAMALRHFAEQAVDVAVIEVGLGGLLDCTNIIIPEVTAISLIGMDHMEILGNTLEEIAAQKAGIFKPGVPAVAIEQTPEVLAVFRETAKRVNCPLHVVGTDIDFTYRSEHQPGVGPVMRVSLITQRNEYDHVGVPLKGEHQALNCGLALAIVDKLTERGFTCPPEQVCRGIEATRLAGRFELVVQSPRVILDGAHNPESIRALTRTISSYMQYDSLVLVFGCATDKDATTMLRTIAGVADKVIFTRAGSSRAASPSELARKYHEVSGGKMFQVARDLGDAMELALRAVSRDDVLCVTGSFYLVGETKKWLAQRIAAGRK